MSDPLIDTAERLFSAHPPGNEDVFPQALWDAVTEAGLTAALLPEAAGGFGTSVHEAMALLQVSAQHAAPIPLAETMLAGWMLARAGLDVPAGVLTLAPVRRSDTVELRPFGAGWHLSGTATRVPWGRDAAAVVVLAEGPDGPLLALMPGPGVSAHDANLAGEPRDTIVFDHTLPASAVAPLTVSRGQMRAAGAALRTVQIAGALSQALSICVDYAQSRVQFGRPIGKFQAIQHALAIMAGQSAAAIAAADMATAALAAAALATDAFDCNFSPLTIGAAKARAGEAASIAAGIAHQVHGAIGFTREYRLHPLTRRLWSWRDEFGTEAEWNAVVGRAALHAGPDRLWPTLTAA